MSYAVGNPSGQGVNHSLDHIIVNFMSMDKMTFVQNANLRSSFQGLTLSMQVGPEEVGITVPHKHL